MRKVPRSTAIWMVYWALVASVTTVALALSSTIRRLHEFDRFILEASKRHDVAPSLVSAIIWQESRYKSSALGKDGEIGLMQVTDGAGQDWARAHPTAPYATDSLWNPQTNIMVGTWYLGQAVTFWRKRDCLDPIPFALAEYNAGRRNAIRWASSAGTDAEKFIESVSFHSTKTYILEILQRSRGGL